MKSGTKTNYNNKTNFNWNKKYSERDWTEKVAIWTSFYRANPVILVRDYFPELKLKLFQSIMLHMMFVSDFCLVLATRGIGGL